MKRIILSISLLFCCFSVFAQKMDKAYYNFTYRIMGSSEVLLFPEDSVLILSLRTYSMFKGAARDTLVAREGKLVGKYFEASFTDKGIILKHHSDVKTAKPKEFKEYAPCDPFINLMMNHAYANRRNHEANNIANMKLGPMNRQWLERPKHETELLHENSAKSTKSIFSKSCHQEFKAIADSVFQKNIDFIESILEIGKQN